MIISMTDSLSEENDNDNDMGNGTPNYSSSLQASGVKKTAEERRRLRQQKWQVNDKKTKSKSKTGDENDERFARLLAKDEDHLLEFVAKVNMVYEQKLKKDAPFMTFVLCGMQSAGKSTIMERFMNAVLNIVQEGTGTRCPLDTTCIHDYTCEAPKCTLYGEEITKGENLTVDKVFELITTHNKKLAAEDIFSSKPLRLIFRAKNVQNMRFVDTPGIISNKSSEGKDNREDIMEIIRSELRRPNTKLCVLLEATEFAKNPIIDFLDESLSGRDNWINIATFLMTKFDKQSHDSRTANKANAFFHEFQKNGINPHLVITPTLPKEDLPAEKLYAEREELLATATTYEKKAFNQWLDGHESYRQEYGETQMLDERISGRLGFGTAKKVMREIMLQDTARRLPEVIAALRKELDAREKEKKRLTDMQKFNDPGELKTVVGLMLSEVDDRLQRYLDGDLESSMKFPERMQTLEEEINDEDNSEWSEKELNFYTEREDYWRDRIAELRGEYPEEIQPEMKFLGGKQYQRAVDFFRAVMVDALPDPFQLEKLVPNVTGYLGGGLQRENWERATVEIVRTCLKDVSHPGINFLVKHVGNIFRRLFRIAMDDIKHGEQFSSTFKLMPRRVEKALNDHFDNVLWDLMVNAADKTHLALEPMYSTVDPLLPTFHPTDLDSNQAKDEEAQQGFVERMTKRLTLLATGSGTEAKKYLKEENRERARSKRYFLPDERTAMITEEETKKILQRSFEYIVALMEFNLINLRFQLNHYLFVDFKATMKRNFVYGLMSKPDYWEQLVEPDDDVTARLVQTNDQISSLKESLQEVQQMNRQF